MSQSSVSRPVVIPPDTTAGQLQAATEEGRVIVNRGESAAEVGARLHRELARELRPEPAPCNDLRVSAEFFMRGPVQPLGVVGQAMTSADPARWKVPLTLEVPLPTDWKE